MEENTFHKMLKDAMKNKCISQARLSEITGIGKSSLSQYMSGKNIPTDKRRREIAKALGMDEDYFENTTEFKIKTVKKAVIPKLLPEEAAKLMGISHQTLRMGLQQGRFPWGYAIKTSENQWTYFINARSFAEKEHVELEL